MLQGPPLAPDQPALHVQLVEVLLYAGLVLPGVQVLGTPDMHHCPAGHAVQVALSIPT